MPSLLDAFVRPCLFRRSLWAGLDPVTPLCAHDNNERNGHQTEGGDPRDNGGQMEGATPDAEEEQGGKDRHPEHADRAPW